MAKKRKPQDATLRNVRAGRRAVKELETIIATLTRQVDALLLAHTVTKNDLYGVALRCDAIENRLGPVPADEPRDPNPDLG
jgi:hypothetical protein